MGADEFDDTDTQPETPSAIGRARTPRTVEIPHQTLADVAAEWRQEQEDRGIVDAMLVAWMGGTGVPTTEVHRRLCMEALAWGRALPPTTSLVRARVLAVTGGPVEDLGYLVTEYTRHVRRADP